MRNNILYFLVLATIGAMSAAACGSDRRQQTEELREKSRRQFYEQKLAEAEARLAHTDSLLQAAESDADTLDVSKRIRLDSLRHAADVQGAQIRYIHRRQQESR